MPRQYAQIVIGTGIQIINNIGLSAEYWESEDDWPELGYKSDLI